jgi:hypothetical protein
MQCKDKSYDTQESLLNLMETGIISETKKKSTREIELKNTKLFATANDTRALSDPLISRFIVVIFLRTPMRNLWKLQSNVSRRKKEYLQN